MTTRITLTPNTYPFISETDKYAYFTSLKKFSTMETVNLLDESGKIVKELNSDDFVIETDGNFLESEDTKLYYKTEYPIEIEYTTRGDKFNEEEKRRREKEELIRRYNEYIKKYGRP